MTEHAGPEYATAPGNDYALHESTYESFVHMAFIGALHVATILIVLAIGAVNGHWFVAAGIFMIAVGAAVQGLMSKSRTASYAVLVLAVVALALSAG
jgi:Bacterial aa3 type cytochrome c oxidase subunit IV